MYKSRVRDLVDARTYLYPPFFDMDFRQKESKEIKVHTTNGKWRILQRLTLHLEVSISATAGLNRDALGSETTKSRAAGGRVSISASCSEENASSRRDLDHFV